MLSQVATPLLERTRRADISVTEYNEAQWVVTYGKVHTKRTRLYCIRFGSVVQAVSCRKTAERESASQFFIEDGAINGGDDVSRQFWVVVSLFKVRVENNPRDMNDGPGDTYALVAHCDVDGEGLLRLPSSRKATTILRLTDRVRRVMVIHKCNSSCTTSVDGMVTHSESLLEEGAFIPFGRREGYPPRSS